MKTSSTPRLQNAPPVCSIVPPHIVRKLAISGPEKMRHHYLQQMQLGERMRGSREMLASFGATMLATPTGMKRRTIYNLKGSTTLPGKFVRGEGDPKSKDIQVNEAYDYSGKTYDFFLKIFGRNSVDGKGMRLDSSVHYSKLYDNAFWNGVQMVYGDGDGIIFERFTKCLDIIGHELTHGITQYEAGLAYQDQPGALNESMSDVFGSMIKQWALKQTAAKADWLIGAGLLLPSIQGIALRSMKAPGTAYDDPSLGKDPQPDHMRNYDPSPDDNGGVHVNSGIPNKAFYLAATAIGGESWKGAGKIWYDTLTNRLRPDSQFVDAAKATITSAIDLFGTNTKEHKAVTDAWTAVGVI